MAVIWVYLPARATHGRHDSDHAFPVYSRQLSWRVTLSVKGVYTDFDDVLSYHFRAQDKLSWHIIVPFLCISTNYDSVLPCLCLSKV